MCRVAIVSGTEKRLLVLFEAKRSERRAARMGAKSGGSGTLRAKLSTRQPLAVFLLVFVAEFCKAEN